MALRVAINGFGRTGRSFLRSVLSYHPEIEVVAINDLGDADALARLFARDSVHGRYGEAVSVDGDTMVIGRHRVEMFSQPQAKALPWHDLGVEVVAESTGRYTRRERANEHLEAGAKRVVISAPAEDPDATFVLGVNEETFDRERHFIVSNASCTTNCLAPLVKVLDESFGIDDGLMTTVHAYTDDQSLVDALHKDARRARSAAINIVPTTTGAAKAIGLVHPSMLGHLNGLSLRVPVPDASITDLVAQVRGTPSIAEVNEAFREAANVGRLVGLLEYSEEPLVSSDVINSPASCIFDSKLTMTQGHLVKVLGWYDNESGYSSRLADLVALVGTDGNG